MERKKHIWQATYLTTEVVGKRAKTGRRAVLAASGIKASRDSVAPWIPTQVTFWLRTQKAGRLETQQATVSKEKKMVFTLIFVLVWTMEETALYIKRSFQCLAKPLVLTTLLTIFYDVCVDYVVIHMSKGSFWTWNHCRTPSALEENSTDMYSCVQPMHKKLQGTPSLPFPSQHSSQWLLMR